ncbi:MAG: lipoyl(octanoyl) transferase LipB [Myxococcales bacterium]|nr:lipoyl(octanoyl) transferase LipB [Myxococcales bacterium]
MTPPLVAVRMGRFEYAASLALQERLLEARAAGAIEDTLLLLEHPPVLTLGRAARPENILVDREELERRGFEVHEIGRGGDVTYHGPGQLVGYPIIALDRHRRDVRRYVWNLEETMIRAVAEYGIEAGRISGLNGTWVGERKIGAVGVRIRRWITMHGFALNVSTDLSGFGMIVPCGIEDKGVTTIAREMATQGSTRAGDRAEAPTRTQVESRVAEHLATLLGATLEWERPESLERV